MTSDFHQSRIERTERHCDRQKDDLYVHPDRPMVDVMKVVSDSLANLLDGLRVTTPAVYLRPAGDPRLHSVAGVVVGYGIAVQQSARFRRHRVRSRADDGHLSAQHIYELRQLVEHCPA